ncbi:HinT-interacting membrane complex lipoprotein P60 [Metamycoplasma equirhinis]|uniref:HinT-interacting membrane complex lipoprotein P60 n=1 Tax=Metamycoplasma equirhinis TaxID=92402 RepID=UPI003594894C
MKKISKILYTLAPIATLPIVSVIAASCNKKSNQTDNAGYQSKILKDILSKNKILTELTSAYLSVFYAKEFDAKTFTDEEKKDKFLKLMIESGNKIYDDTKEAFDYFASSSLKADPQFFWNLKATFTSAEIDTTSYNPSPYKKPNEEEMKFVIKHSNVLPTSVRLQIQKMLLTRLYLLKDREEFKKLANNASGDDKYQVSQKEIIDKKDTPTLQKDIYKSLDLKNDSLYLIKYLIENSMIQSWEFEDTRDMNLRWSKANVSSFEDFNNLAKYQPSGEEKYGFNPVASEFDHLISISNSENYDFKNLRAYKGFAKNSINADDLSSSLYSLLNQKSVIYGFIDPRTNKVYSQDNFKFSKILAQEKKTPIVKPTVKLNEKATKDTLNIFDNEDFEIDGFTRDTTNKSLFTKEITVDSIKYKLLLEQKGSITFDSQFLTVPLDLTVESLEKRINYDFKAKIKYDKNGKKFEALTEPETAIYNLDKHQSSVNMYKDGKITAKYVVKVAPLAKDRKVTVDGKEEERKIFSFEDTPWKEATQQRVIANNIIIANSAVLFKEAFKYFTEMGFKIDLINSKKEVIDTLKIEGLI